MRRGGIQMTQEHVLLYVEVLGEGDQIVAGT